jgi:hypothetical protein
MQIISYKSFRNYANYASPAIGIGAVTVGSVTSFQISNGAELKLGIRARNGDHLFDWAVGRRAAAVVGSPLTARDQHDLTIYRYR